MVGGESGSLGFWIHQWRGHIDAMWRSARATGTHQIWVVATENRTRCTGTSTVTCIMEVGHHRFPRWKGKRLASAHIYKLSVFLPTSRWMNACGAVNVDNYSAQFLLLCSFLPDNFHGVRERFGESWGLERWRRADPDVMRKNNPLCRTACIFWGFFFGLVHFPHQTLAFTN